MLWFVGAVCAVLSVAIGLRLLKYVQLEGYSLGITSKITSYYCNITYLTMAKWCAAMIAYVAAYLSRVQDIDWIAAVFCIIADVVFCINEYSKKAKKNLVLTKRSARIIAVYTLFTLAACALICFCGRAIDSVINWRFIFLPLSAAITLPMLWAAMIALTPIEYAIKRRYKQLCKKNLDKRKGLVKIGITGSMGKTSVKFILNAMLSQKFKSYCTPSSYNTPMGICKAVEEMPPDTQVFICEMGARHKGDIKEICDMVNPTCGIITGITSQHLETFKNIETIKRTKFELIQALPVYGIAVFNKIAGAGELYDWCELEYKYAVDGEQGTYADNIEFDGEGTKFTLHIEDKEYICRTKLIGIHNISNISVAAAMCNAMGMSGEEIVKGIENIEQIPHRLQVIKNGRITIIDDSFNSNPEGAKYALETLAAYSGRKVVAAQGMVELGEREYGENYTLGENIAKTADIAILIGPKKENIKEGMIANLFDENSIYMTDTLDEAQKLFTSVLSDGDVLLIENDLPDNY